LTDFETIISLSESGEHLYNAVTKDPTTPQVRSYDNL